MNLLGVLPFARFILEQALKPNDIAVDCTAGNGHDTLFLAKLLSHGKVYSFDIQQEAIQATQTRLMDHDLLNQVTLIHQGHEHIATAIPKENHPKIKAAIFNLGYLPGGRKDIVTKPSSTIQAIKSLLAIMPAGAVIVLVIYHGHEEGKRERDEVETFAGTLNQKQAHVLKYQFVNQENAPPFILAIEKR